MAELFKDPYKNIWHGSVGLYRQVVVTKHGRKSWTVKTLDNGAQFDTKQKAFKAAQEYLDHGINPYMNINNLARLWDK